MALPIRETPILEGEDAKRFIEKAKKALKDPISKEKYERAKTIYNKMIGLRIVEGFEERI